MFYLLDASQQPFHLRTLLLGEEDWGFLPEVLLRSMVMFLVSLIALRIIGKRGIMQGVFELVTIITLGSAAGDPMFYKKVGLLPAILVFATIIIMYKVVNYFVSKYEKVEHLIEGKHVILIKDGKFAIENFEKEELEKDELFSDLRLKDVSQLGQVRAAYIEASGQVSVFFYPDDDVKWGLPILPELYEKQLKQIGKDGHYACGVCGFTSQLKKGTSKCPECRKQKWVEATNEKRIK